MGTMRTELSGWDAIRYARAHGLTLSKYADPTEAARTGLSPDEAETVADEDPNLIHLPTLAEITGAEFDQRHPDGRAWRAADRPDYGFRLWQEQTATERGLVIGEDYEAGMWTDYETVRAWCYGVLKLDGIEQAR